MSRDPAAAAELTTRGVTGVPAFLVGDELIVGMDTARLEKLLAKVVVPCPSCGKKLRLPTGQGRIRVNCPECMELFETTT